MGASVIHPRMRAKTCLGTSRGPSRGYMGIPQNLRLSLELWGGWIPVISIYVDPPVLYPFFVNKHTAKAKNACSTGGDFMLVKQIHSIRGEKNMRWNYLWFWWPLMRATSFSPAWHWKLGMGECGMPCRFWSSMSHVACLSYGTMGFPDFRNVKTLRCSRFLLWVFHVFPCFSSSFLRYLFDPWLGLRSPTSFTSFSMVALSWTSMPLITLEGKA